MWRTGSGVRGRRVPERAECGESGLEFAVRVFGELETVVMARLWDLGGDATVRDVLERIQLDREIAYTTVLSTMENLHRKGHLTREREGKAFRYRTALSRAEHTAGLMREALSSNDEDAETVLTHFVGEMSAADLDRLRAVVARRGEGPAGR